MGPWQYLINPIDSATEGNYSKALKITNFHFGALLSGVGTPFILTMKNSYEPFHLDFVTKHDNWITQEGSQGGETLNLKQMLRLLMGTKARQWDVGIQNVYDIKTVKYKAIMPHRRKPFQNGKQDDMIAAIKSMSNAIGTDADLADVKDDADLFYTQINEILLGQKGSISHTSFLSQSVDAARVAMAVAQYGNLGTFIHEYRATPQLAATFFDLNRIRNPHQALFTKELQALIAYCICKHTFGREDEVEITNPNSFALKFYLVELKTNKIGELFYLSEPGTKRRIKAAEMGDLSDKFVMVYNPSEDVVGEWEFELL